VHLPNGFVFSYPNGGWEYPAFLIVISAVQALIGEGAYALGRIAARPRLAHA
jgi:putative oxidoreductase